LERTQDGCGERARCGDEGTGTREEGEDPGRLAAGWEACTEPRRVLIPDPVEVESGHGRAWRPREPDELHESEHGHAGAGHGESSPESTAFLVRVPASSQILERFVDRALVLLLGEHAARTERLQRLELLGDSIDTFGRWARVGGLMG